MPPKASRFNCGPPFLKCKFEKHWTHWLPTNSPNTIPYISAPWWVLILHTHGGGSLSLSLVALFRWSIQKWRFLHMPYTPDCPSHIFVHKYPKIWLFWKGSISHVMNYLSLRTPELPGLKLMFQGTFQPLAAGAALLLCRHLQNNRNIFRKLNYPNLNNSCLHFKNLSNIFRKYVKILQ